MGPCSVSYLSVSLIPPSSQTPSLDCACLHFSPTLNRHLNQLSCLFLFLTHQTFWKTSYVFVWFLNSNIYLFTHSFILFSKISKKQVCCADKYLLCHIGMFQTSDPELTLIFPWSSGVIIHNTCLFCVLVFCFVLKQCHIRKN